MSCRGRLSSVYIVDAEAVQDEVFQDHFTGLYKWLTGPAYNSHLVINQETNDSLACACWHYENQTAL